MATNTVPIPATQAALSLLSLSSAGSPQPASSAPALGRFVHAPRSSTAASVVRPTPASPPAAVTNGTHKRRLSGAVQTRRRMSDAANAVASPVVVAPLKHGAAASPSVGDSPVASGMPASVLTETEGPANGNGSGKKKGQIFKCETCSKVYRHPNCLVKHRWEHSPHWREASKFLLSKHQQVQMLEAAAILSHISPQNGVGTSLPEDRSLWPAYLSGGLLPTPGSSVPTATGTVPSNSTAPAHHSDYREREQSVSTSAVDDRDESSGDEDDEREDSGYGSSSAMAVPGYQARPANTIAMSFGGHEYTISSSHAGCDAGAHLGSMRLSSMGRSISSSSFGMSSLRGGVGHDRDDDGMEEEPEEEEKQGLKWEEDVSMAMDMDL